jgi:RND family efflux transporter MFP subunit
MARPRHRRRWIWITIVIILVAAASYGGARWSRLRRHVPTAVVRRGLFTTYLTLRGQLAASRSVTLKAPTLAGDQIRILKLVENGARVQPGEVVIGFDASKLRQTLQEDKSALKQADAEIREAQAKGRMAVEQDRTDLLKARYTLESARLDASQKAILSRIDGEEKQLAVANAEQAVYQAEQKLRSDQASTVASVKDKEQARDKALFDVRQTQEVLASMTVRAPIQGLVTVLSNLRAGGFFENGPPFKPGDQAWAGADILELPDLSTIHVVARVDEADRGKLRVGQVVTVRVEAVPGPASKGKISRIGALAKVDFSGGWPPSRNFEFEVKLAQSDSRMRPGMTATVRVPADQMANLILIPADAAFQKGTETLAYVLQKNRFVGRPIEIAERGDGELAVDRGLKPGERVALQDPTGTQ